MAARQRQLAALAAEACVVATAFVLYAESLDFNFVWDDRAALVRNGVVNGQRPWQEAFVTDFWGMHLRDK